MMQKNCVELSRVLLISAFADD